MKLKSPQFGSSLNLDCYVKTRYTHGGQISQFRQALDSSTSLKVDFIGLVRNQIEALMLFLVSNAGKRVLFEDENSVSYFGFVVTEKIKIEIYTYAGCPTYRTSFDFEGELI